MTRSLPRWWAFCTIISVIRVWTVPTYVHECEPYVRAMLNEMAITSDEETEIICSAVYNHSDKNKIGSPFDEIIKDADVLHHWLRNPK